MQLQQFVIVAVLVAKQSKIPTCCIKGGFTPEAFTAGISLFEVLGGWVLTKARLNFVWIRPLR